MAEVQKIDNSIKTKLAARKTKQEPIKDLKIKARFVRMTPDKLRLVAGLIKGKKLSAALNILQFSSKAAAKPLSLVLKSALAQVKDKGMSDESVIKTIIVDEGPKLKRRRIIHRGRATTILKRRSHITVVLSEQRKSEARTAEGKAFNPKS